MKTSSIRFVSIPALLGLLFVSVLLGVACNGWSQSSGYREIIQEDDFKLPLKDLEELSGEIVWIQGAALRGDPRPYRNPAGPVAAYEQGLLDEEGELWTLLDTPSGRELRYNPELRGQRLILRGWLYPKSKIMEVHAWEDNSKHPVRNQDDFPEPEKIPFDPTQAASIESIRPVAPSQISPDLLNRGIWEIQEGKKIDIGIDAATQPEGLSPDAEELNRLLEEEVPMNEGMPTETVPAPSLAPPPLESPPSTSRVTLPEVSIQPASPSQTQGGPPSQATQEGSPRLPLSQPRILNQEGEPLASPEEFDEALQKALLK